MRILNLGIDLGRNSCSIVTLDAAGLVDVQRWIHRDGAIVFASKLAFCTMAREAYFVRPIL